MVISSPGLASGIDIKGIVSQLVALERAPLTQLQTQANGFQAKLSVFGTITSMVNTLGDAGAKLAAANTFSQVKATSSQPESVTVSVAEGTAPTALSLGVVSLAKAQLTPLLPASLIADYARRHNLSLLALSQRGNRPRGPRQGTGSRPRHS